MPVGLGYVLVRGTAELFLPGCSQALTSWTAIQPSLVLSLSVLSPTDLS